MDSLDNLKNFAGNSNQSKLSPLYVEKMFGLASRISSKNLIMVFSCERGVDVCKRLCNSGSNVT